MAEFDCDAAASQTTEEDLTSEKSFTPRSRSKNILQDEDQHSDETYTLRTLGPSDSVGLENTSVKTQATTNDQPRGVVAQSDHRNRLGESSSSSEVTQTVLYDVQFTPALTNNQYCTDESETEAELLTHHSPAPVRSSEEDSDRHNEEKHSDGSDCIRGSEQDPLLRVNNVDINSSTVDESVDCEHNTLTNRTTDDSGQHNWTVSGSREVAPIESELGQHQSVTPTDMRTIDDSEHVTSDTTMRALSVSLSVNRTLNEESGQHQTVSQTDVENSGHSPTVDLTNDTTLVLSQSRLINRTSSDSGEHQTVTARTTLTRPTIQHLDSCNTSQSSAISSPIATPTTGEASLPPPSSQSLSNELSVSPYVVVKDGLVNVVGEFESPGLLYARSMKEKHNLDLLRPADEVAEDVLEMIEDEREDDEEEEEDSTTYQQLNWSDEEEEEDEGQREGGHEDDTMAGSDDDDVRVSERVRERRRDSEVSVGRRRKSLQSPENKTHRRVSKSGMDTSLVSIGESSRLSPLDPGVLRDLEKQARKVASNLEHIMDNLHNSLHAMTVCAKQSVLLHRESVDNLHTMVDANVKASYSFLAKFEELQRHTLPLNDLAQQIKDIDRVLKVFERNFRTP